MTAAEAAAWKALAPARATAVAAQGEAMPTAEAASRAAVKATSTTAMETAATPAMAAALETAATARVRATATATAAMRPGCSWQADKEDGERRNAGHEFAAHVHVKALRSLGV